MAADEPSDGRRTGAAVVRGPRRLAGEIRERLPWIEEQLAAGYSREQVVIALPECSPGGWAGGEGRGQLSFQAIELGE